MGAGAATAEYISETWVPHDSPPAHDEGYRLRIGGREITDAADWDRAYGTGPLWQEAQELIAEGYEPEEAATELRLRYGRQAQCTGDERITAIEERGGTIMANADWKTPGIYGERPLWQIAAELHDEHGMSWEQVAAELAKRYGIEVSWSTVADRVNYYQAKAGHPRQREAYYDWQTPGVFDRRPLVEIAAAIYDQNEGMTWSRVVEILEEHLGVTTSTQVVSRTVAKWRREGGEVEGPLAIEELRRPENGNGGPSHGPECECGDCINRREHEIDWTMDDEEDPFGDGGEEDGDDNDGLSPQPPPPARANDSARAGEGEDDNDNGGRLEACPTEDVGQASSPVNDPRMAMADDLGAGGEEVTVQTDAPAQGIWISGALCERVMATIHAERQQALEYAEVAPEPDCELLFKSEGITLSITAGGPVEMMQRLMQCGSLLTMGRQLCLPVVTDRDVIQLEQDLDELEAREDELAEGWAAAG